MHSLLAQSRVSKKNLQFLNFILTFAELRRDYVSIQLYRARVVEEMRKANIDMILCPAQVRHLTLTEFEVVNILLLRSFFLQFITKLSWDWLSSSFNRSPSGDAGSPSRGASSSLRRLLLHRHLQSARFRSGCLSGERNLCRKGNVWIWKKKRKSCQWNAQVGTWNAQDEAKLEDYPTSDPWYTMAKKFSKVRSNITKDHCRFINDVMKMLEDTMFRTRSVFHWECKWRRLPSEKKPWWEYWSI